MTIPDLVKEGFLHYHELLVKSKYNHITMAVSYTLKKSHTVTMLKFSIHRKLISMFPQFPHDNKNFEKNYEEYVMNHIKKGTTTCALTCTDGVVLAADTRASAGYFIVDRNVMKIQRVDEHLGMTIAGGVADAQNLVDLLRYNANLYRLSNRDRLIPVKSAARLCSNVLFNQRYYPYYVQIIMAGFDKNDDGSQIYNIDLFGSMTSERFISTGSGSPGRIWLSRIRI
jgi:20S proteasome alpha/beta subunit